MKTVPTRAPSSWIRRQPTEPPGQPDDKRRRETIALVAEQEVCEEGYVDLCDAFRRAKVRPPPMGQPRRAQVNGEALCVLGDGDLKGLGCRSKKLRAQLQFRFDDTSALFGMRTLRAGPHR